MTPRLLALDLDGTTFGEDLVIRPAVIAAVRGLVAAGVHVIVSTGRPYRSALPFVQTLGTPSPVICFQGALVRSQTESSPIASWPLPNDVARDVIDEGQANRDTLMVLAGDETFSNQHDDQARYYEDLHPGTLIRYRDLAGIDEPIIKMLVVTPPNGADAAIARYRAWLGDHAELMRSNPRFAEITGPGVSKGRALRTVADRLAVPRESIVAIGDQENDLPLFEAAGTRIAMGNAASALKAAADLIAPTVEEEGVAWAIDRLFGTVR